ncbi:hypothetical protein [Pseudoalteromonas holothuriae]|nr:hypothetical protein [Pseudoalteromonas sp. CIP111854]
MEKMFKKSLLALALSGAAVSANAATVVTNTLTQTANTSITTPEVTAAVKVSKEGIEGAANTRIIFDAIATANDQPAANIQPTATELGLYATTDIVIKENDTIIVTLPGGVFDTTLTPTIKTVTFQDAAGDTDADVTASTASFVKYDGDKMIFAVTGGTFPIATYNIGGFALKSTSSASITPSFKAVSTVTAIGDYATGSAKAAAYTIVSELAGVKVTKSLNGVIDVAADRKLFTAGNDTTTTDVVTVNTTTTTVDKLAITGPADFDITLSGNFSALDTDGDNKIETGEGSVSLGATAAVWAADLSSVTFKDVAVNTAHNVSVNISATAANRKTLATQSFTTSVTSDYTATTAKTDVKVLTGVTAGSWTLNGSEIEVPYLPFGDNTAPILRLTNASTKSGDLTVRYMIEGTEASWKTLGVLTTIKPGITNIADLVINAVKADAGVTKGKVALELVTNVPDADVDVTAGFKVVSEQDRGIVTTIKK